MSRKDPRLPPFIMHYLEMRRSLAWRHLPDNARRALDVLEQKNSEHAGSRNGKIACTFDEFAEVGRIRRQSIALAIRQCVEFGFTEITFHAKPSVAEHRRASEYRLTYAYRKDAPEKKTDDWRRIKTEDDVHRALDRAATTHSVDHKRRATKAVKARRPTAISKAA